MLSCGCDEYGPDVFSQKTVKARKEHKCCECGDVIKPGDVYDYIFGVWEGDASTFKTCEKCADLRDSMYAMGFCMMFGSLQEDYKEYLDAYNPPRLSA